MEFFNTNDNRSGPVRPSGNGIVVLDKPAGISSSKALAGLRRQAKVGHAGTLDPFATGVLVVLVGDATRLSSLAMALPKTYTARVQFGRETDTLDTEGRVIAQRDPGPPRDLGPALAGLTGTIRQMPPAYSALKVAGRRAYRLAREGKEPPLEPREVTVHRLTEQHRNWPDVDIEVVCGSGTYVRALARDLGRAIGLPASLTSLRRTAIGPYHVDDADPDRCRPAMELVEAAGIPFQELDIDDALRFVTGQHVASTRAGRVAVRFDSRLAGLAEADGKRLRASCVFASIRREIEAKRL